MYFYLHSYRHVSHTTLIKYSQSLIIVSLTKKKKEFNEMEKPIIIVLSAKRIY